jgi:hypothetical protein
MGRAMNSLIANRSLSRIRLRRGISILEVIACTALVAVMVVPVAGVIRASGQAIAQSETDYSTASKLRRGLDWIGDAIRDGQLLGVSGNALKFTGADGRDVKLAIVDRALVMTDGSQHVEITADVRQIDFSEIRQPVAPHSLIGIGIALTANDSITGKAVVVKATVALPPQS